MNSNLSVLLQNKLYKKEIINYGDTVLILFIYSLQFNILLTNFMIQDEPRQRMSVYTHALQLQ